MSVNKVFLYSLSALMLLTVSAKADINDLVLDKTKEATEKLGFSKDFLQAFSTCSSKREIRNELGMDILYEIKGYDAQGNCLMVNSTEMNGFKAVSSCKFNKENLAQFIAAQKEIRTLIERASSLQEILSNPSYITATGMLLDEEICQNKHSEIDQSKELREHLKTCSAYETSIDILGRGSMTMEIVGLEGGKCHFIHKILMKAPSAEEIKKMYNEEMYEKIKDSIKDSEIVTDCKFSELTKNKYIKLLEETVIPASDSLDISIIEEKKDAQKNALEYLTSNPDCKTSQY